MADCLFCRIARKEIPASIVAEDEFCLAFRDINAQAPVHVLIVPRNHVASLNDVKEPSVLTRMYALAARVVAAEGLAARGYRCVINTNADGGQTVFHLHLHILGGRRMVWPPG